MRYIHRQDKQTGQLETVDECETRKDLRRLLIEYRISDPAGRYYSSPKPCKNWIED